MILPLAIAERMSLGELVKARQRGWLLPMAGAEVPEADAAASEPPDEGAGDDGGEPDDGAEGEAAPRHEDGGRKPPADFVDDDDDEDDNRVTIDRGEHERLKRVAADADKARKKAEKAARDTREKDAREAGNWQALLDERDERIREVEAERDETRYQLDSYKREIRVSAAAVRLGYKDPQDAAHFLSEDETEDDVSTERALKRLSRNKPYLVEERRASGTAIGGGQGSDGGLSMDDIKKMKPEEINARWSEVQAAMAAGGQG